MQPIELKVARLRRKISGKYAADALGLTMDGYYKKEQGGAQVTLADAFTLTKALDLTLGEFVAIFFDGDLPFLQSSDRNCNYGDTAFPLKEARQRSGYTAAATAAYLGIGVNAYTQREKGRVCISLDVAAKLSRLFGLSLYEFNDVFFRGRLPFGKEDLISYTHIIPQKVGEINGEASNYCRV